MKRNVNLDLLRLGAMLMVVVLHYYNHGLQRELDAANNPFTFELTTVSLVNYLLTQTVVLLCQASVDVYVLITGYFMLTKRFSFRRILRVWFQAVFTALVIAVMYSLLTSGADLWQNVLLALSPRDYGGYWFVKCYVRLMLLSPLLLFVANRLSRRQFEWLMVVLILAGTTLVSGFPFGEYLHMRNGYSLPWFCVLFLSGAYLRRWPLPTWLASRRMVAALLLLTVLFVAVPPLVESLKEGHALSCTTYRHNGPAYFMAVMLFSLFARPVPLGQGLTAMINRLAPLAFGVYLIHDNTFVRDVLFYGAIDWRSLFFTPWSLPLALLFCLAVFVVCLMLDYLRLKVFEMCRINRCIDYISKGLDRAVYAIFGRNQTD